MPGVDSSDVFLGGDLSETSAIDLALIRQELHSILESRHFVRSRRSCQFLQYIVEQKISGREDLLKERIIGIEVFGRDADYSTGDDPVVRVQAGEVRRRLELYQGDIQGNKVVSIEIPLGSYAPVFHLRTPDPVSVSSITTEVSQQPPNNPEAPLTALPTIPEFVPVSSYPRITVPELHQKPWRRSTWLIVTVGISILILIAIGIGYDIHNAESPNASMDAFWMPLKDIGKPVLICLGKPITYLPSSSLYDRYAQDHPGEFATPMERRNRALPFAPEETFHWGDMIAVASGPAMGGVRAGMNISSLLGTRHIPFAVRFGNDASFAELRESPSIIIGALDNQWMAEMSSGLPVVIQSTAGVLAIHEVGAGNRTWIYHDTPQGRRDYALITRQLKGPTGQFTVKVEGLGDNGTEAGAELISEPQYLNSALQDVPKDWPKMNLQLIVATDVIGGKPGPPQLVTFKVW